MILILFLNRVEKDATIDLQRGALPMLDLNN